MYMSSDVTRVYGTYYAFKRYQKQRKQRERQEQWKVNAPRRQALLLEAVRSEREERKLYLTLLSVRTRVKVHVDALPRPEHAPVWDLLRSTDNSSWIALCGFTKEAFETIYTSFAPRFLATLNETVGVHSNYNVHRQGGRPGSLFSRVTGDSRRVLMLVLFFLTSTTPLKYLSVMFGASPSSISLYLRVGLRSFNSEPLCLPCPTPVLNGPAPHRNMSIAR